uniref:Probable DNA-directed RNA polymerase II subunit RPB11 n=1 Tax=Steinernema glaseri TaxID=37863 RepID=A0A1I7YPS8_9BILA
MNAPQAFESFMLFPGEEKISYTRDTKVPNSINFTIMKEDHTLGNMIKYQLLKNKDVLFAGYRVPHPLEHRVDIRVQTTPRTTPIKAFLQALRELQEEVTSLHAQFVKEAEWIGRYDGEYDSDDEPAKTEKTDYGAKEEQGEYKIKQETQYL